MGLDAVKDLEVKLNAVVVPFLTINDVESMGKEPLVILKLKIRMVSLTKLLKDNEIQNFLKKYNIRIYYLTPSTMNNLILHSIKLRFWMVFVQWSLLSKTRREIF